MRNDRPIDFLAAKLGDAAAAEDGGRSLAGSVEAIVVSKVLEERRPVPLARTLVAIAEANLSAARLAEGHVNALRLLRLHRPDAIPEGGFLGVWGADGDDPLRLEDGVLRGSKRYASGLGIVTHALVTVADGDASRLALVDVADAARHRPGSWAMLGMRATISGDVDLTGLDPVWIGPPGAYHAEPSFVGGVWRIAALQLGGTLGLLGAARDELAARERLDADAQVSRLAAPLGRALAAFGLVEKAAAVAEGPEGRADADRAVALSIQARLLTEDLAQDAVAATERAVGLPHFADGSRTGRVARDLATYCRQVARDAMEQRAGRTLLARPGPLSGAWHG
ncbi:hypothetical protein BCF33_2677 [Hasllibacter halocynthiae]|uniref:Alkylation response protein AidB-like acyl-CoA dehydrogenase n=1 Tax=Hasllibacter halocynthiae TaxID=595589 RepID=A0A2T0X4C4_9RHOB|nr:acyl-CoA dehydrogenase [Hasllibacter halocynthiae]PRY93792.1 hypothetical protein BCF33_2677 [Hasllibacter halocynthiae]